MIAATKTDFAALHRGYSSKDSKPRELRLGNVAVVAAVASDGDVTAADCGAFGDVGHKVGACRAGGKGARGRARRGYGDFTDRPLVPDDLRRRLPAQTPIEIRFRYLENGRLAVTFQVEETDKTLQQEIARENSLTSQQLDAWRHYVSGIAP